MSELRCWSGREFLAIFASNLDEFFMKRVAVIREARTEEESRLFLQLREKLLPMLCEQSKCYRDSVIPALAEHGILLLGWDDLSDEQKEEAGAYFDNNVSAALTPLVINPRASVSLSLQSVNVADVPAGKIESAASRWWRG